MADKSSTSATRRVLVVDDDADNAELVAEVLTADDFEVSCVASAEDAVEQVRVREPDLVVTDVQMRAMTGIELCHRLQATHPQLPVVVMTGFGNLDTAVQALRAGAFDFLPKPFDIEHLRHIARRAHEWRRLTRDVERLERAVRSTERKYSMIGSSAAMQEVYDMVARLAALPMNVLITGESGTGKELAARALHEASDRRDAPFVAVNCAAIPESLIESELFGHEKGAFTGAGASRLGHLREARGGTVFLDEIGEIPFVLQSKLLRALQERKVMPVGGSAEIAYDARIVAATNRDLLAEVQEKRFREDLYYRLNVVELALPPLRHRGNDVLDLARVFLSELAERYELPPRSLSPEVAEKLLQYDWPGNVRELRNCMERAIALGRGDQVGLAELPDRVADAAPSAPTFLDEGSEIIPLDELEKRYILHIFERVGQNRSVAAERLGIDRKTLYRKLQKYGAAALETG